jgi:hypothetical protein
LWAAAVKWQAAAVSCPARLGCRLPARAPGKAGPARWSRAWLELRASSSALAPATHLELGALDLFGPHQLVHPEHADLRVDVAHALRRRGVHERVLGHLEPPHLVLEPLRHGMGRHGARLGLTAAARVPPGRGTAPWHAQSVWQSQPLACGVAACAQKRPALRCCGTTPTRAAAPTSVIFLDSWFFLSR